MSGTVGLAALHAHLELTGRRPVDTEASRWLGEAEAIAEDLQASALEEEVAVDRLETLGELLAEVRDTGDSTADEHVVFAERARLRLLKMYRDD